MNYRNLNESDNIETTKKTDNILEMAILTLLWLFSGITLINDHTVKPLITNTSEEFIKCRLADFSMSFILYYVYLSICENK